MVLVPRVLKEEKHRVTIKAHGRQRSSKVVFAKWYLITEQKDIHRVKATADRPCGRNGVVLARRISE